MSAIMAGRTESYQIEHPVVLVVHIDMMNLQIPFVPAERILTSLISPAVNF
jgi:hypothetical protein